MYRFFKYLLIGGLIFLCFLSVEFNNRGGNSFKSWWVNYSMRFGVFFNLVGISFMNGWCLILVYSNPLLE